MLGADADEPSASETAKVLVVQTLNVIAEQHYSLAVEPLEREGLVANWSLPRKGEGERLVRAEGGNDSRAEGGHELRWRAGWVVGDPSVPVGLVLVDDEAPVLRVGVLTSERPSAEVSFCLPTELNATHEVCLKGTP